MDMQVIDNISTLLGDDLREVLNRNTKLKIAASCFSIYAFEALKRELAMESLEFVFRLRIRASRRDRPFQEGEASFHPKAQRERSLYGSEFEIQLRNKLTQRAIARECAAGFVKANFRSNKTKAPMQQFICVENGEDQVAYMPVNGSGPVDLGIQKGDAVLNIVNRFDGAPTPTPF